MVLVACHLSQSLRQPSGDSSPVLDFWLSALQRAMDEDPFWGPGFWEDIEARALPLVKGIQQLVQQCHSLWCLLSSNGNLQSSALSTSVVYRPHPSKPSEGHSSLANEGIGWVEKIVLNYWSIILGATTEAGQKKKRFHVLPSDSRNFGPNHQYSWIHRLLFHKHGFSKYPWHDEVDLAFSGSGGGWWVGWLVERFTWLKIISTEGSEWQHRCRVFVCMY